MANSFKYIFVDSKIGWNIGSFHHSLSFSANGKTLAGTTPETSTTARNGKVQFWDTDSGAPRGSYDGWSLAQFSPTEADKILLLGGTVGTVMNQQAVDSTLWKELGKDANYVAARFQGSYTRDGTRITTAYTNATNTDYMVEWDNQFARGANSTARYFVYSLRPVSTLIYLPNDPDLLLIGHNDGRLIIRNYNNTVTSIALSQVGSSRIGACAWSLDKKWLATGDDAGDTRLWDASNASDITLAKLIPRADPNHVTSLVFVPDSTALIILCEGSIRVWDIGQGKFLDGRAGLPAKAKNITFDHARNRLALAVDDKIYLYELKLPETQPQVSPQPKGKPASVPPELAAMDITGQVIRSKPDPFVGLYFDIYRGAWKVNLPPVTFQHVVAIKSLRPGFDPRSKPQERQDFQALYSKSLNTWYNMKNDNIVPLLGISMAFGKFPAMITSWMMNGLLTEYLNSGEDYDKMQLVIGVGSGVAYLHSQNVVHSDIRASSVLVDELGNARLADPGLLNVLEKSPLMVGEGIGAAYRWMAPELLNDPPAKTSFATDIYAFTMTSLEIFTGNQPFAGVGAALIPSRILQSQRPGRPADITDLLWALWNEGWNQNAGKRPDIKSYLSRLGGMV